MINGLYRVEFMTWLTEIGADQGIGRGAKAILTGENVGHASVDIAFPYTQETQRWVAQYCKRIKLPSEEAGESPVVDVPVYYTTLDGSLVDNPERFVRENPNVPIATHVYLSLTKGRFLPHWDERDPFKGGYWKRQFNLQTAEEDQKMELVGAHGGFRRGYDGFQDIELRVNDQLADQYIVHEPSQYIHNLTPEEVKYYTLTSNQKQFVAFFLKTIDKFDDTQNDRMNTLIKLNKLAQNIKTNGKSDKRLSAEYKIICKKNPIIKRYFSYHKRVYCEINKLDPSELSKQQEKYILRDFLKTGFSQLTENSLEYLKASEHQENLELFRPILSLIESQSMSMEELYEQLETISQDIGKINKEEKTKSKKYADKQFEKLMEKYHLLKILYD